jgi:hypothetical protein
LDEYNDTPYWLHQVIRVQCPYCKRLLNFWKDTTNTYSQHQGETFYFHNICGNKLPKNFEHYSTVHVIVCSIKDCDGCKLQYERDWHPTGKGFALKTSYTVIVGERICNLH